MRRFIIAGCMMLAVTVASGVATATDYVLALSWEPAFCAQAAAKGRVSDKPECGAGMSSSYSATNLILHGLWPQPESNSYCGVPANVRPNDAPGRWDRLPAVQYERDATKVEMATYMPGVVSYLDRHEWVKHGTCSNKSPDDYFSQAFGLVKAMAPTRTAKLIHNNIGGSVTSSDLCSALVADFGSRIMRSAELKVSKVKIGDQQEAALGEVWIYLTDRQNGSLGLTPHHLAQGYAQLRCDNRPLHVLSGG